MTVQPTESLYWNQYEQQIVAASEFDFNQLATIYNQTRVDYIVPMPMNAKRMADYVKWYDIDLEASPVSMTADGTLTGLSMLGLRDERAWVSRLGVLPSARGRRTGSLLMEHMLAAARLRGARRIQLEVINGNEPAHKLFLKFGFSPTRNLRVIRRPPGQPDPALCPAGSIITPMSETDIRGQLARRPVDVTWLEESRSLLNAGGLQGLRVMLPTGAAGWVVCQATAFQLAHLVIGLPCVGDTALATALLCALHAQFPNHDTKTENIPADHPATAAFAALGYVDAFHRIEMMRDL